MSIDINNLSADQRKALLADLAKSEKEAKQKRKENYATFKKLSADYVTNHIDELTNHHNVTEEMIKRLFDEFGVIMVLKEDLYGDKVAKFESHTSTLEDGSASITIGHNVTIGFDGTESAGVAMIQDFLESLASDEDNVMKLSKSVRVLLKPSKKTGFMNPASIIQLNTLREEFNSEVFSNGVDIIINAQQRRISSMYVAGWKYIEVDGRRKKLDFRFAV